MRMSTWSALGCKLAESGQSFAGHCWTINQFLTKNCWVLSGVAWAVLLSGLIPFFAAEDFASGEELTYIPAVLLMVGMAFAWGHLFSLWTMAFSSTRWWTKLIQIILLLAFLAATAWALYSVHRIPVYTAFLASPIVMCFRHRHFLLGGLCGVLLVALMVFTLQPETRLVRFVGDYETGCWCCGIRQRAIFELLRLGPNGREALLKCVIKHKTPGCYIDPRSACELILQMLPTHGPAELMDYRERVKQAGESGN
jgi:hypothetical protein